MERYGSAFKGADSERGMRKKPTGASAAHVGTTPLEGDLETLDNDLVALCPAFRNEVGGDSDWAGVSTENKDNPLLTLRGGLSHDKQKRVGSRAKMLLEGTIPSKEIMEHKSPMDRQVLQILQPQSSVQFPFEFIDYGALYYRNHFYQQGTTYIHTYTHAHIHTSVYGCLPVYMWLCKHLVYNLVETFTNMQTLL